MTCPSCDGDVGVVAYYRCDECHSRLDDTKVTPNEELRALASHLRNKADRRDQDPDVSPVRGQVLRHCAGLIERLESDELEAVIDDE